MSFKILKKIVPRRQYYVSLVELGGRQHRVIAGPYLAYWQAREKVMVADGLLPSDLLDGFYGVGVMGADKDYNAFFGKI